MALQDTLRSWVDLGVTEASKIKGAIAGLGKPVQVTTLQPAGTIGSVQLTSGEKTGVAIILVVLIGLIAFVIWEKSR